MRKKWSYGSCFGSKRKSQSGPNFIELLKSTAERDTFGYLTNLFYQTCENMGSIGRRSCKEIMKEKNPLWHNFVCFQMHNKRLQA